MTKHEVTNLPILWVVLTDHPTGGFYIDKIYKAKLWAERRAESRGKKYKGSTYIVKEYTAGALK